MRVVETPPHEFSANLLFDEQGLDPFFAADSQVKSSGGAREERFEHDGERWIAKLYYQDSGILPPEGGETPGGTPWALEEVREFRIQVKAAVDDTQRRRFNAHIAPRWQGMRAETSGGNSKEISIPADIEEGVNVRVSGANIAFGAYHDLPEAAAEAVGINGWYFRTPHPHSNVVDAARYVRLHTDRSGSIHARDGPLAQMGHLLEDDRSGYRKLVQNEDDERGRNLPGYYHTVTLGEHHVQEAFPDHSFPREIKHYYAREALKYPEDQPLRHPKLEITYQRKRWDGKLGVDELDDLVKQLDQTLHSVLADARVQVHTGEADPYVADAYFEPENIDRPDDWIYGLDLTQIEHDQESIVLKYLSDGLSPVARESIEFLSGDGGEVSPTDIAEEYDRHVDSVRRALRERGELFHREYGKVALRSRHVGRLLHKKLKLAEDLFQDISAASAKAAHAADPGLDETTSAFIAWAELVGADVNTRQDARLKLRMNGVDGLDNLRRHLQEGYQLWLEAGNDPVRFREATIHLGDGSVTAGWYWL